MAFNGTAFKSFTRAAVLAMALGASSLMAAPVFAQSGSTGFSIEFNTGGASQNFGGQRHDRRTGWDDDYRQRCLTNRDVARAINGYGYNRVEIVRELRRNRVEVEATRGNWIYAMRVDKCTGQVDQVQRTGRAFGGGRRDDFYNGGFDGGGLTNGGFGFQFNFGN
ncbi:hypothetical protein [Devosia sp.]|uniref:hypothetical protein n=1 Tax=Devosia sp. TaxID=1871048 RepID=UPI002732D337|nr:hypothetical protein [Devosia sp.]MDP2778964.1 hypothetical protein [Devosia sp.]